jgi:hypothetical protein
MVSTGPNTYHFGVHDAAATVGTLGIWSVDWRHGRLGGIGLGEWGTGGGCRVLGAVDVDRESDNSTPTPEGSEKSETRCQGDGREMLYTSPLTPWRPRILMLTQPSADRSRAAKSLPISTFIRSATNSSSRRRGQLVCRRQPARPQLNIATLSQLAP